MTINNNETYSIYMHKNLLNGKVYIGVTKQKPEQRWAGGEGYKTCTIFYKAIKKYGWDNFEHTIIETTDTRDKASELERYWIAYYDSTNQEKGYNCDEGGYTKRVFSEKTREKMRQSRLGEKNWRFGTHLSEETKQKISEANKGRLVGEKNPMYGKHHTEETKEKIRQNQPKDKPWGYKPVRCVTTGQEFDSIKDAIKYFNLGSGGKHISEVCRGRRKTCGRHPETDEPLKWEYVIKEEEKYNDK